MYLYKNLNNKYDQILRYQQKNKRKFTYFKKKMKNIWYNII